MSLHEATSFSNLKGKPAPSSTLAALCRRVVDINLERYPPESFAILDEQEFEEIISLRHERTRPQRGKGGLDGTGRMNPAVGDKFLLELEEVVPHLSHSTVVDKLAWKDIVAFKFRVGGLSRPKSLTYPWPIVQSKVEQSANFLRQLMESKVIDDDLNRGATKAINVICTLPMDISLLKSSGIGKIVKKFIRACDSSPQLQQFDEITPKQNSRSETPRKQLESVLSKWMAMAAKQGVKMKSDTVTKKLLDADRDKDLEVARSCKSWRDLYGALKAYDEKRRSNQGARMRERRHRLDSVRPKIVKVRHASTRQNSILGKCHGQLSTSQSSNSKMDKLRNEARVTSSRRSSTARPIHKAPPPAKASRGFGAAVAFATGADRRKRKASTTIVQLSGGKRMKVPDSKKKGQMIQQNLFKKGRK